MKNISGKVHMQASGQAAQTAYVPVAVVEFDGPLDLVLLTDI